MTYNHVQKKNPLAFWLKVHPWQALGRGLWVMLHLTLNTALAFIVIWGPLDAPLNWALRLGAAIGLGTAVLWARQQLALIRGAKVLARRRRRPLLVAPLIALALGLIAGVQLYRMGAIAPVAQEPTEAFDRLWSLMGRHYAFFEHKGVDWDAVYARYAPQAAEAESETDYYRAVAGMLNELPDGHTGLQQPEVIFNDLRLFGYAGEYEGQAVVIAAGPEAERAGIEKGALLLEIDGQPVEERLETWAERLPPSSTPWHFRKRLFLHLLATCDETLDVTYENPDGTQKTVTLIWDPPLHPHTGGAAPPVITSERLDSGVGLIRIRSFDLGHGLDLVRDFDAALDSMMDAPAVIIDVRNNGGGFSVLADLVAGRFFSEPFTYGKEVYRTRIPQHVWRTSMTYRVRPRGETYEGPVAVLTNPFTFSSADVFVVAMADSGRAQIVGRPTSGASGNPISVRLPNGGRARFSTGDFLRSDGRSLEGVGVQPDLEVAWTIEDVRQEHDPDVRAAEQYLLGTASE